MIFNSDGYSKNFSGLFPGPVEITTYKLMITPNNPKKINKEDMRPFDRIEISFFSPYDQCMIRTNQDSQYCERLSTDVLFDKTLTIVFPPLNQSLGNISVNITQVMENG